MKGLLSKFAPQSRFFSWGGIFVSTPASYLECKQSSVQIGSAPFLRELAVEDCRNFYPLGFNTSCSLLGSLRRRSCRSSQDAPEYLKPESVLPMEPNGPARLLQSYRGRECLYPCSYLAGLRCLRRCLCFRPSIRQDLDSRYPSGYYQLRERERMS